MPMETSLAWLLAGFVLVIAELLTGTFYLLVLGVAAFAGAGVAWLGQGFGWQAFVAAVVAVAGVVWVQRHPRQSRGNPMASLDAGQAVTLDHWTDRAAGRARVRYRDSLWDAEVAKSDDPAGGSGGDAGKDGETFFITAVEGSTLKVSKRKP
jgi:membrane protein implicated in regulation of membrane protease activity